MKTSEGWPLFPIISLLLLSGCASTQNLEIHKYTADPALIEPYTIALDEKRAFKFPYVATFSDREKTLFYVAANHVSVGRYPSLFENPTFLTIKEVFSKHKIDAVIVEGIAPWEGKM